jgi:hypothetical protein
MVEEYYSYVNPLVGHTNWVLLEQALVELVSPLDRMVRFLNGMAPNTGSFLKKSGKDRKERMTFVIVL